jgi:hypothetical protein
MILNPHIRVYKDKVSGGYNNSIGIEKMGSYAECWLGSFYVGSTSDNVDPAIIDLFRSSDKQIISGTKKDVPFQLHHWTSYLEEDESVDVVFYSAPVNIIRDRLNLIGYTFDTSKAAFTSWVNKKIEDSTFWAKKNNIGKFYSERLTSLKALNVDEWLLNLKQIRDKDLKKDEASSKGEHQETLIGYMLSHNWYGYPGLDLNVAIRLALEILPDTDEFIYDITDLVLSSGYSKDDDLFELYSTRSKTIILTEGSIDTWVISESLQLLYPHLADYFTFMDFEAARVGGGAGNLANIVKAFSGTGIVNKVIALFDNDAAAATALRGLRQVQIPLNIKVLQLPDTDFLRNYPTIGPSGLVNMNVNGLGASIELYLGKDVLIDQKENLRPIQWTGYISDVAKYQGEVLGKEEIQKKFKKKVAACKSNKTIIERVDWTELRAVLQILFSAFHDFDHVEILSLLGMSD